jgi:hypothetical protein
MSRCSSCGAPNPIPTGICEHHIANEENWAVANRVFCDWLHRRIEPAYVPPPIDLSYEPLEVA